MKYNVQVSPKFKKEYKKAERRGYNMYLIKNVIAMLANGQPLPASAQDHELKGTYKGYRECHIQPDWLLIYKIEKDILVLTLSRTGTHSDVF